MPAEPERFAALFKNPTIAAMHALSSQDFERFVAYVLRRAGYDVKEVGPHILLGLDLELRLPGKRQIFGGVECKKYAPNRLVPAGVMNDVRGARSVGRRGAKPFVFTTSDFTDAAHQVAEPGRTGGKRVYLLNGNRLLRYIPIQ